MSNAKTVPAKPLAQAIHNAAPMVSGTGSERSVHALCRTIGIPYRYYHRWLEPDARVTVTLADRVSVKGLKLHPMEIWGWDWLTPTSHRERQKVADE